MKSSTDCRTTEGKISSDWISIQLRPAHPLDPAPEESRPVLRPGRLMRLVASYDGQQAVGSQMRAKPREQALGAHPMNADAGNDQVVGAGQRRDFGVGDDPVDVGGGSQRLGGGDHRVGWIDGVDVFEPLGQGEGELARAATQIQQPAASGREFRQPGEKRVGVGRAVSVGARHVRIVERQAAVIVLDGAHCSS